MYSVVLMAAMTTGGEVPDFGRRRGGGCSGGYSCCGCYGGGYAGYRGYGCYGGGYGCYGGGYGGYGGYGCHGGGYGCYGGYGGYRGAYGGYRGGYGGYRGYGSSPYAPAMFGAYSAPPVVYTAQAPVTSPPAVSPSGATPATFVVNLPADAKLIVEGVTTRSTSSRRVFISPPLRPGQDYAYSVQAQLTRDGETRTVRRTFPVRAGQQSEVTLDFPTSGTTTARR